MLHRGPEQSKELSTKFRYLLGEYQSSKWFSNAERENLILFIKSFCAEHEKKYDHLAALGACTYGLIKIGKGFNLFTVPRKKNHYQLFGSQLGQLLQDTLYIQYSNPLDYQQAVVYLTALYHHLENYPRRSNGISVKDASSEALQNEVGDYIKKLIEEITQKRPSYKALLNNFEKVPIEYKKIAEKNKNHFHYAEFINLLNLHLVSDFSEYKQIKTVKRNVNAEGVKILSDEKASGYIKVDAYKIRYALLLFLMEEIEGEYQYFSPEGGYINRGSDLYKACKKALNIQKDSKEIPCHEKQRIYIGLLNYLYTTKFSIEELTKLEKSGSTNIGKFYATLCERLTERFVDTMRIAKPGALPQSYLEIISSVAATYGVTIVLTQVATAIRMKGSTLTYFNMLKPEAALLITLLAYSMESLVVHKASDAVNKVIITTVSEPVIVTYNSVARFTDFCRSMFVIDQSSMPLEVIDDECFLKAIHDLPNHIVTDRIREKLMNVVDLPCKNTKAMLSLQK